MCFIIPSCFAPYLCLTLLLCLKTRHTLQIQSTVPQGRDSSRLGDELCPVADWRGASRCSWATLLSPPAKSESSTFFLFFFYCTLQPDLTWHFVSGENSAPTSAVLFRLRALMLCFCFSQITSVSSLKRETQSHSSFFPPAVYPTPWPWAVSHKGGWNLRRQTGIPLQNEKRHEEPLFQRMCVLFLLEIQLLLCSLCEL